VDQNASAPTRGCLQYTTSGCAWCLSSAAMMLARSVCHRGGASRLSAQARRFGTEVWPTHGQPPLTKIVATIGPASDHKSKRI
jgi:hypothetical protein